MAHMPVPIGFTMFVHKSSTDDPASLSTSLKQRPLFTHNTPQTKTFTIYAISTIGAVLFICTAVSKQYRGLPYVTGLARYQCLLSCHQAFKSILSNTSTRLMFQNSDMSLGKLTANVLTRPLILNKPFFCYRNKLDCGYVAKSNGNPI